MNSVKATMTKGGYFHLFDKDPQQKWHLRFGVTPNCNFRCSYCAPEGGFPVKETLSIDEVSEILHAAFLNGITRVHWTGGEPTVRTDILECMKMAKTIGYTDQVITTNGYRLARILDQCINNGLTRVIVSLDTLKPERFKDLTGLDILDKVLKGMESAVLKLDSPTKMSCCTMRSTLPELGKFIQYAEDMNRRKSNKGEMVIKLNQFFPSNPAQLTAKGKEFWEREVVSYEDIIDTLSTLGSLKPYPRKNVEGDNPSYEYYTIGASNVKVGILAMHTWKYRCGGCHKLRIKPNGDASICMASPDSDVALAGHPLERKTQLLKMAMQYRETELEHKIPIETRQHFSSQLGEQRFGKIGNPIPISAFYPNED